MPPRPVNPGQDGSPTQQPTTQVAHIKEALEEAKSGSAGIPHEEIERWMDSWDTEQELPRPEPKHRGV